MSNHDLVKASRIVLRHTAYQCKNHNWPHRAGYNHRRFGKLIRHSLASFINAERLTSPFDRECQRLRIVSLEGMPSMT